MKALVRVWVCECVETTLRWASPSTCESVIFCSSRLALLFTLALVLLLFSLTVTVTETLSGLDSCLLLSLLLLPMLVLFVLLVLLLGQQGGWLGH